MRVILDRQGSKVHVRVIFSPTRAEYMVATQSQERNPASVAAQANEDMELQRYSPHITIECQSRASKLVR